MENLDFFIVWFNGHLFVNIVWCTGASLPAPQPHTYADLEVHSVGQLKTDPCDSHA